MKAQNKYIAEYLVKHGRISRNYCLRQYITRLAARIKDLKDAGWEIVGTRRKTRSGVDYEYTLITKP